MSSFYPLTTGEIQILLDQPGPAVKPPLKVVAEFVAAARDLAQLKQEIETKIKSVLRISSAVQLVPAGTLPKFEMKGQLVRKLYEE